MPRPCIVCTPAPSCALHTCSAHLLCAPALFCASFCGTLVSAVALPACSPPPRPRLTPLPPSYARGITPRQTMSIPYLLDAGAHHGSNPAHGGPAATGAWGDPLGSLNSLHFDFEGLMEMTHADAHLSAPASSLPALALQPEQLPQLAESPAAAKRPKKTTGKQKRPRSNSRSSRSTKQRYEAQDTLPNIKEVNTVACTVCGKVDPKNKPSTPFPLTQDVDALAEAGTVLGCKACQVLMRTTLKRFIKEGAGATLMQYIREGFQNKRIREDSHRKLHFMCSKGSSCDGTAWCPTATRLSGALPPWPTAWVLRSGLLPLRRLPCGAQRS